MEGDALSPRAEMLNHEQHLGPAVVPYPTHLLQSNHSQGGKQNAGGFNSGPKPAGNPPLESYASLLNFSTHAFTGGSLHSDIFRGGGGAFVFVHACVCALMHSCFSPHMALSFSVHHQFPSQTSMPMSMLSRTWFATFQTIPIPCPTFFGAHPNLEHQVNHPPRSRAPLLESIMLHHGTTPLSMHQILHPPKCGDPRCWVPLVPCLGQGRPPLE